MVAAAASSAGVRRVPVQRRSRDRVERILRAAERTVVRGGVAALTTRSVASAARVPVASVYQYFADREAIIAALIERHVAAMDERLARELAALKTFSVRTLAEATVAAYTAGYQQEPSYVVLWFQGRVNADIASFVRARMDDLAQRYHAFARTAGLTKPGTDVLTFKLAAEMIDAFLAIAYREDLGGDERVVREGLEMVIAAVERHATRDGIRGVPASKIKRRLEVGSTPRRSLMPGAKTLAAQTSASRSV